MASGPVLHSNAKGRRGAVVVTGTERLPDGRRAGFWLSEVAYVWRDLRQAGWEVLFVCPRAGPSAPGAIDRSDPVQRAFLRDPVARECMQDTISPAACHGPDFAMVVFAGGAGALYDFPFDVDLREFTTDAAQAGAILGACGHGVAGLVNVSAQAGTPVLAGRSVTAPSPAEDHALDLDDPPIDLRTALASAGASLSFGDPFRSHVVGDGRIVTGQNPATAPDFARVLLSATTVLSRADETAMT